MTSLISLYNISLCLNFMQFFKVLPFWLHVCVQVRMFTFSGPFQFILILFDQTEFTLRRDWVSQQQPYNVFHISFISSERKVPVHTCCYLGGGGPCSIVFIVHLFVDLQISLIQSVSLWTYSWKNCFINWHTYKVLLISEVTSFIFMGILWRMSHIKSTKNY